MGATVSREALLRRRKTLFISFPAQKRTASVKSTPTELRNQPTGEPSLAGGFAASLALTADIRFLRDMGQVFQKDLRYTLSGKWKTVDNGSEELDQKVVVYQPESLERVMSITKFNRRELKVMYRGFKQACPSGFITVDQFKDIFSKIFPHGDASRYATFVFNAVGDSAESQMTFAEIALVLSTLSRGTAEEKLEWTFRLYDQDRDGYITFNELLRVVLSIYDLMGSNTDTPPDRFYVKARAKEIFESLDASGQGAVSKQEFVNACLDNPLLCQSLEVFNTLL